MHKKLYLGMLVITPLILNAPATFGAYNAKQLQSEIVEGVDIRVARTTADTVDDAPAGQLGYEVYETRHGAYDSDVTVYIPTSMYVRGGAGMALGFASDRAGVGDTKYEMSDSWNVQLGLGWNLSSYVRGEFDFQNETFNFRDLDDAQALSRQVGATLYFDLLRRWYRTGDVTQRRRLVPFIGFGTGVGTYEFQGDGGADGFFVAPRGVVGVNVMLNDLIGIDLAWQYQMRIGNGFGWNVRHGGVDNVNNVMVSLRANF